MKPLSLAEVNEYVEKTGESSPVQSYLKQYCVLSAEKAKALAEELRGLNNVKIKEEHIVKVVDFLPRDAEDMHKIFHDVSLDEKEVSALLGIVSAY